MCLSYCSNIHLFLLLILPNRIANVSLPNTLCVICCSKTTDSFALDLVIEPSFPCWSDLDAKQTEHCLTTLLGKYAF